MSGSIELAHPRAENALLACLINERMAPTLAGSMMLKREHFAFEVNGLIFDAIMRVVSRGAQVDGPVLLGELESNQTLDVIGGESVIDQIAGSPYDLELLGQYVDLLRDRSMRRRLMTGFEQCSRLLYSVPDTKELLEGVQTRLYRTIDEFTSTSYRGISGSDLATSWSSRGGTADRIDYSWRTANAVLGGRSRGDLSIWGCYTSDGKSTIALRNVVCGCREGLKVGFVLLEMTDDQITARLLAYMTGIEMGRLERDDLTQADREHIDQAFEEINGWNLTIYCDPSMNVADVRAVQMQQRYDLIVIDYLQRFDFKDFNEIPRMAKQLKNVALTTKCHIDLFSQITPKGLDNRSQNPFPKMDVNMLYGGKATAHEADNVIFLWAHRAADEDGGWQRTGYGDLYFEKVRQGRPGLSVRMKFDANRIQWEES